MALINDAEEPQHPPPGRRLPVLAANSKEDAHETSGVESGATDIVFARALRDHGAEPLTRGVVTTLQVNLGKLCNMACLHCHVEAGPKRTEIMARETTARLLTLLAQNPGVATLDLTGGAPELNPHFRALVTGARALGRRVIDRCNLTVLFEPGLEELPEFLATNEVTIVASLPCFSEATVEKQRGRGAFQLSLEALRRLNGLGYGKPGSRLVLRLVYNPVGPSLPPEQKALEARYKHELMEGYGIEFHDLLTLTNMPIKRFESALRRDGTLEAYMGLLESHFNVATTAELMCRSQLSVGYDGALYDCDFNQMLDLSLGARPKTIWDIDTFDALYEAPISTGRHCFGCTAGAGSSCGGAIL